MTVQNLTYNTLLLDVQNYAERTDEVFVSQIPRFINLAEKRIASQFKTLWQVRAVTTSIKPAQSYIAKPARWRKMISLKINGQTLYERDQEMIALYQVEIPASQPLYWADYDYINFAVAPFSNTTYSVEMLYYEQVPPLSPETQTNLLTLDYPQLILFATMLESAFFLKDTTQIQYWHTNYDELVRQTMVEDQLRSVDRDTATIVAGGPQQQQQGAR